MDYIDTYMDFVKPLKGSRRYHRWAAISVVSAALERRCYHKVWKQQTYPNLYITLAGPAGCGKTFTTGAAVYFLKELNKDESKKQRPGVSFMTNKLTPAALIKQLERCRKKHQKLEYSSLFSYADELSSFIMDMGGGSLADDIVCLYDSPDIFEKEIVSANKVVTLHNISISALWDTTPDFLQRYLPREMSKEGLASRVIFVADFSNPTFDRIPEQPDEKLENVLLNRLYEIYCMSGQVHETPEAHDLLNRYHAEWIAEKAALARHSNFAQYMSRREKHRLKLCMVSAASRGSKVIEAYDAERSEEWLRDIEPDMCKIFGIQDGSKAPDAPLLILGFITKEGIYEDELIRKMAEQGVMFPQDSRWDGCIKVLKAGDYISTSIDMTGRTLYIKKRDAH